MLYSKYLIEIAVVLYIKYIPLPKMLHFGTTYADIPRPASLILSPSYTLVICVIFY